MSLFLQGVLATGWPDEFVKKSPKMYVTQPIFLSKLKRFIITLFLEKVVQTCRILL
jgi:hypothetical protein